MTRTEIALALATALAPLAPTCLDGQSTAFGVKSGLNVGDVSSSEFQFGRAGSRVGFVGGFFLTLTGTTRVSFQPELLYSQKGISILGPGGSATAAIDYLDIPLLIRIGLTEPSRKFRARLVTGGFLGLEVGCDVSGDIEGLENTAGCEELLTGRGESDAGLVFGAGVDIGLSGRYFLTFDGRYNLGLINLRWEGNADRVRSRVWSFMGGIGVLLGN